MKKPEQALDLWRIPALLLWGVFFMAGLYPEWVYDYIRELGEVAIPRAMVNSAAMLSVAWAGYIGWFTVSRCREAQDTSAQATAKGVQVFLLGLAAFIPVRLENFSDYQNIPVPELRWILFGVIGAKVIAWLYLAQLILRYYLFAGYFVFRNMPALFPSAHEFGKRRTADSQSEKSGQDNNTGQKRTLSDKDEANGEGTL